MSVFRVEKLAEAFGCISDDFQDTVDLHTQMDGFAARNLPLPPFLLAQQDRLLKVDLRRLRSVSIGDSDESSRIVLVKFYHLHLPALVRAFQLAANRQEPSLPLDYTVSALFGTRLACTQPYLSRFIRDNVDGRGKDLFFQLIEIGIVLVGRVMGQGSGNQFFSDALPRFLNTPETLVQLMALATKVFVVSSSLSSTSNDVQTPIVQQSLLNINDLLDIIRSVRPDDGYIAELFGSLLEHAEKLRSVLLGELLTRARMRSGLPWDFCSAIACRCTFSMEKGEMMALSKCLQVRYCSKQHQRDHWKIHKATCFPPAW